ncbi:MAG: ankyrin repeat domain-containing protein [Elusimicrobia bacterium]|nr:ankyrin repeat domain-containing protein [Elusimicrobiota bacterium]
MRLAARVFLGLAVFMAGCAGAPAARRRPAAGTRPAAAAKPKTLHEAAAVGDLSALRSFLSRGTAADARDVAEVTALHRAAGSGQTAAMDELLSAGADVEAKDAYGATPLHHAAWAGQAEAVHRLLGRGAKADARNDKKATPLMFAAASGNTAAMEALLARGADLAARNEESATALHAAAAKGRADAIRLLVSKGAEVDAVDRSGGTPLFTAGIQNHSSAVEALLKAGAKRTGNNGLVGLELKESSGTIVVVKAVPGRPAEKAGVKAGDLIVSVDGRSTSGLVLTDAVKLLRGPAGVKVDVAVRRPGVSREQVFTLVREAAVTAPESSRVRAEPPAGEAPPPAAPRPAVSDADAPKYRLAERPDDIAVVIGVERYAKLVPAEFAERDAEAVRRHVLALGVPQRNVIFLAGQAATRASIQGYVEEWLPKNVKPGSRVFFYYSGHGAPDPRSGDAFLVPWDGDPMFLKSSA